jgi:hypothetical protein
MEYKLHNGSGSLCCKGCSRQDKKLNTYDWLADIPGNAEESDMVEVQFKNTRKGYYRNSNKIKLEKLYQTVDTLREFDPKYINITTHQADE